MRGFLDTSMVVRYLILDVPEMAERAAAVINGDEDLRIIGVVLAEVGHVLRSVYLLPRELVVDYLVAFVRKQNIYCHERQGNSPAGIVDVPGVGPNINC